MKKLLFLFIVITLLGCESISTKKTAFNSAQYTELKNNYQPCFIIDKKLSNHAAIVTTPEFMDNSYGFMVENHFKRDNTVVLEVGQLIKDDIHHLSKEFFNDQCVISSFNDFTGQGNLIIKVDLITSKISIPKNHNDNIVSEIGVLYSFFDPSGNNLLTKEIIERDMQKASSTAAYRKVTNKTINKVYAASKNVIAQSLTNLN